MRKKSFIFANLAVATLFLSIFSFKAINSSNAAFKTIHNNYDQEQQISIDMYDFFNELPSELKSTGSTPGLEISGQACGFKIQGKVGHGANEIDGGFKLNASSLKLIISMGDARITGVGGIVYTSITRKIYVNGITIGETKRSNIDYLEPFARMSADATQEVIISTSGQLGFTELVIYYTATTK